MCPFLQPMIVTALGPVVNVSSGIAQTLERSDRIPPTVSVGNLVSLSFIQLHAVSAIWLLKLIW